MFGRRPACLCVGDEIDPLPSHLFLLPATTSVFVANFKKCVSNTALLSQKRDWRHASGGKVAVVIVELRAMGAGGHGSNDVLDVGLAPVARIWCAAV
jgi:hypothetical protein